MTQHIDMTTPDKFEAGLREVGEFVRREHDKLLHTKAVAPYLPAICPDCGYFDCEGHREFIERDRSQHEHDQLNGYERLYDTI